ncbi:MAG: hypothetical protein KAT34_06790 [Candidatus Aminicenantes bacterium]|nr:hypothetical protein [Candidatus Aminicenantes bacterium]
MKNIISLICCFIILLLSCFTGPMEAGYVDEPANGLIADFYVLSEEPYRWSLLETDSRVYINRKQHLYTNVPPSLEGQLTLLTSNRDKYYEAVESPFISFKVKKDVKVYVLYSDFFTQLEEVWLNERKGWHKENFVVLTNISKNKATRRVYSKTFTAGTKVILDGNGCVIKNCSMYTVVIVPVKK